VNVNVFLLHDCELLVPTFFRRSRGTVPLPVMLRDDGVSALGVGAEWKSTVCLTRG
jgi:hydrogenase maturation protein HypF